MTTVDTMEQEDGWTDLTEGSTVALFAGDEGGMSAPQRTCLIHLLKYRYLSRDTRPELWDVLVEHEHLLRSRLNDLFLTLHVDLENEVAYKRQAVPDNRAARFPTLLHDKAYSREETVLLVHLREQMQRERAAGVESVLVDREDLIDSVIEFRPFDDTDLAGARRRAEKAIDSLKSMGVLHDTRDQERLAVSRVLDSLMPLARLRELLEWLRDGPEPTSDNESMEAPGSDDPEMERGDE